MNINVSLPESNFVEIYFTDLSGQIRSFSMPAERLDDEFFENGLGIDGSSFKGWQPIYASDMILKADKDTLFFNPFGPEPLWGLIGNIHDPNTDERYNKDPRFVASKAENYLLSTGIADKVYFGPEAEFFLFEGLKCENSPSSSYFKVLSRKVSDKYENSLIAKNSLGVSFPVDQDMKFRHELVLGLKEMGFVVEVAHHEGASGQHEIGVRYDTLLKSADKLVLFKHAVKSAAALKGMVATFMPKPLWDDNGSGLHLNISLFKQDNPIFNGVEYGGLSQQALYFIGGILAHAQALCAFTNPFTNSYKRLTPGFEAPNRLAYSARNRSAAIRIPTACNSNKKRIEARFPDPSANPYLAMAALLMAGLDGMENRIDPGDALDRDIYALKPEENHLAPYTPETLSKALEALENDHDFLLKGDVFTNDLLESYLQLKWNDEVKSLRLRPHPFEYEKCFNY